MISGRSIRRQQRRLPPHVRCFVFFRRVMDKGIKSTAYAIFITCLTIWALFAPDIKVLAFEYNTIDWFLDGLISFVFFVFVTEIGIFAWLQTDYLPPLKITNAECRAKKGLWARVELFSVGSFYFWLDVIAAASLIFEVRAIPI